MKLKLYPKDHLEIADSLIKIGQLHFFLKRFSEAKEYFKQSFDIYMKHANTGHPMVQSIARILIETSEHLGEADEANKYRNYIK